AHDGRLKILDFGLARSQAPDHEAERSWATRPGLIVGTPGYIAPEQLAGERGDARADVYAFGVLLYEYASGSPPFVSRAPDTIPGIGHVIARGLRQSPDERYATAGEIAAALDSAHGNAAGAPRRTLPWRVHQLAIVALYFIASVVAWQLKAWKETPVTLA